MLQNLSALVCLIALTAMGPVLSAQEPAEALDYLNPSQVAKQVRQMAAKANGQGLKVEVVVIGRSHQEREILAIEIQSAIALPAIPSAAKAMGLVQRSQGLRSALLVVAGAEGDRLIGTTVVMDLAKRLLNLPSSELLSLLDGKALYLVPQLNPDGAQRYFTGVQDPDLKAGSWAKAEHAGNARILDWDRDGRSAHEDVPLDLDGDGFITMMRVPDPKGKWVVDPDDARLMKKADVAEGENGSFRYFLESKDRDADGDYGENPSWGVHPNRNFPRGFKYHVLANGLHAVSEPETKALMDYAFSHPNIAMTLVYGGHDNLAKIPKAGKEPKGGRFRRARPTGIWKEDRKLLEAFRKQRETAKAVLGKSAGSDEGGLASWSYFQFGVPTLAVNLFEVDTAAESKKKTSKKKGSAKKSKSAKNKDADGSPNQDQGADKDKSKDEAKKAVDPIQEHLKERRKSARKAWHPFDHPQLGRVEIGGWRPFLTKNPSEEVAALIAKAEFAFLSTLIGELPKVVVKDPAVTKLASGLFEIRLQVVNEGGMPTACKQGSYSRGVAPVLIEIVLPSDRLVQGEARNRVNSLAAKAGEYHGRWVVRGKSGDSIRIWVAEAKAHPQMREVVLP